MRNKLLKAVSTVMASLVFAGAFVFISPKADVLVGASEIDWEWNLDEEPDENGIRWFNLSNEIYREICGSTNYSLPDPDLFPSKVLTNEHLYIRLIGSFSVSELLDYTDRSSTPVPVTIDLNGNNIYTNSEAGLINLAKSASYEFVDSKGNGVISNGDDFSFGATKNGDGGFFNVAGGCTLTIDGVNLYYASASGNGGAIYAGSGSYVNISDSSLIECMSSKDGFAIYADSWSNVTLTDVTIYGCDRLGGAGVGAFYNGSVGTVFNGKIVIKDNRYNEAGDNLYIKKECPISVNSNSSGTDVLVTYETPAAGKQLFLPGTGVSLGGYVYDDNANYVIKSNGQLAKAASSVTLKGYSLLLDSSDFSKISIKFVFHVSENLSDRDLYFYINGNEYCAEGDLDDNHDFVATYKIDYLHIVDEIDITAKYFGEETDYFVQPDAEISVKAYAQAVLADTSGKYSDTDKTVIKGMVNYGTYMQAYFNVGGEPANSFLTSAEKAEAFCSESEYQALKQVGTVPAASEDIAFYGTSFVTKGEGELWGYIYFKLSSGKARENFNPSVDGRDRSLGANANPKFASVYVMNITPYNLDQTHEIGVAGHNENTTGLDTFTYCPLDYVYLVYNYYQDNEPLYNYVKALYAYHKIVKGAMENV